MASRKWAGYIALHPVTVCTDHQSLQYWHKEHVDTPSGPASRRARWHHTLAEFDFTVVYVPRKDNIVAHCLSRWAYPARTVTTDVSAHGNEAQTAEAKKVIDMERMGGEEGVKWSVVMAADAPLGRRMSGAVQLLAPEGAESNKHLFPEWCLQDDWTDDYAKSEAFESEYGALTDPDGGQKWQKGLTEEDGKLHRSGGMLVPEFRLLELCEAWHHQMMQPQVKKQALDTQFRLEINEIRLYNAIKHVKKGFLVCQACNPDNQNVQGEAQWKPIPNQPMESVAMDVFCRLEVHIGKEVFDCVVLCVDRHSGYIVAVAARKKGLLAKEVAVMMIRHWLTVFGVPGTFCSDHGAQFTGGWFKAVCYLMGIRHGKSVAYLSQIIGRAEVAGQQLFEKLRKIHLTKSVASGLRRCGRLSKTIMTPAHRAACRLTRFFSAGIPWVGDSPCRVMACRRTPRSSLRGKRLRRGKFARSLRRRTLCEPRPSEGRQRISSGCVTRSGYSDPGLWALTAPEPGSHPERWSAGLVMTPTASRWGREQHESQLRAGEPDVRGKHVFLDYTAHAAYSDDDYAEEDDYTIRKILSERPSDERLEEWSSRYAGEAMGTATTPGNTSPPLCHGSTPPSWSMSAGTRQTSRSLIWRLSPG